MQIYWFKTRVKKMRLSALGGITNLVSFCFGAQERKLYRITYRCWPADNHGVGKSIRKFG